MNLNGVVLLLVQMGIAQVPQCDNFQIEDEQTIQYSMCILERGDAIERTRNKICSARMIQGQQYDYADQRNREVQDTEPNENANFFCCYQVEMYQPGEDQPGVNNIISLYSTCFTTFAEADGASGVPIAEGGQSREPPACGCDIQTIDYGTSGVGVRTFFSGIDCNPELDDPDPCAVEQENQDAEEDEEVENENGRDGANNGGGGGGTSDGGSTDTSGGIGGGAIAGIVVGSLAVLGCCLYFALGKRRRGGGSSPSGGGSFLLVSPLMYDDETKMFL